MLNVKLGEILDVQSGFAFKTTHFSDTDGTPLIRIRDLPNSSTETNYRGDFREDFIVESGNYLIGMDGNFRCYRWRGPRALLNQRVCRLRNFREDVDPEYIYYGIQKKLQNIEANTSFATVKHISGNQIKNITLTLPPLEGQRRIVDTLSRAEGIVRLRREAQKKAEEIIPALFLDMFGDPATNPKGWPVIPVRDFILRFEGGKNVQAGENSTSEFRILKVSAVTSGTYIETEAKPAPLGYSPPESYIVREGDLLFSRANTEQLVGATTIVNSTNGKTLLPDKLWRFVWREERSVSPLYVCALFQNSSVRAMLSKIASGTSSSMKNISQEKLFKVCIPFATYQHQLDFEHKAQMISSIQSQQAVAMEKAVSTFDALLSRIFQMPAEGRSISPLN